ncbi:choice-of-anchor U domain-containing protein [Thermodesulfobacteriota bacterium]
MTIRKHRFLKIVFSCIITALVAFTFSKASAELIIVDHTCTDITQIPQSAIEKSKDDLHIAYGHTSHGSQLTTGMTDLVRFANGGGLGLSLPDDIFAWNNGGTGGALDLHDYAMSGDVGYYPQWVNETRTYLDDPTHSDVNVIIWSWCGQASGLTQQEMVDQYLAPMTQLELDYPNVTFVYMTGHADGNGETGNLHLRNEQIRDYCIANNKTLYDFYDIDCYDPDNNYFGDKLVNDNCDYDSDMNGTRDTNWATEWQSTHTEDVDWYSCTPAHTQPLNGNLKTYAAWWLWARIAGWNPGSIQYALTVNTQGAGTVTLDPSGGVYDAGTEVALTATADPDWMFCGWTGDLTGVDSPEIVTMNADKNVTATFLRVELDLGIQILDLNAVDPDDINEIAGKPQDFLYGMMEIEIEVAGLGATGAVTVTLPSPAPAGYEWYKYTATLGWILFGRNEISGGSGDGAEFNPGRDQITIYITDNGPYDTDPTPGIIKDPLGLGSTSFSPQQSNSSSGSSSGGCFISSISR